MNGAIDKPRKMFENARAFSKGAYVLNQQTDLALLGTSTVNAALALELYFKTLFILEKGKDFRINGRNSHDFRILFDELSFPTRQRMESAFDELIKNRNMSDIERLEKVSSVLVPRDLHSNLSVWKDVFVKMRYIHEPLGKEMTTMFFPEIESCVVRSILLLRQEWRKPAYDWQKVL